MNPKGITHQTLLKVCVAAAVLLAVPLSAVAQSPAPLVTLNYQNTPLPDVLKSLFAQAGQPYTLDAPASAPVTVTVQGVSLDTALKTVLAAADTPLAFDHVSGYHIRAASPAAPAVVASAAPDAAASLPPPTPGKQWRKVYLQKYDAGYIGSLFGGRARPQVIPPNLVTASGLPGGASANGAGRGGRGGGGGYGGGGGGRGRRGGG